MGLGKLNNPNRYQEELLVNFDNWRKHGQASKKRQPENIQPIKPGLFTIHHWGQSCAAKLAYSLPLATRVFAPYEPLAASTHREFLGLLLTECRLDASETAHAAKAALPMCGPLSAVKSS